MSNLPNSKLPQPDRASMVFPLPVTDNIVLKPLQQEDATRLFHLVEQNRAYLRQWLPWLDGLRTVVDETNHQPAVASRQSTHVRHLVPTTVGGDD